MEGCQYCWSYLRDTSLSLQFIKEEGKKSTVHNWEQQKSAFQSKAESMIFSELSFTFFYGFFMAVMNLGREHLHYPFILGMVTASSSSLSFLDSDYLYPKRAALPYFNAYGHCQTLVFPQKFHVWFSWWVNGNNIACVHGVPSAFSTHWKVDSSLQVCYGLNVCMSPQIHILKT